MALFQPTNIIPSSFTVGVVDASNEVAQISWQVNGNSAMTAFKIDFFDNDTDSTEIAGASTGKKIVSGGFYGIDRFGRPKMFTWTATDESNAPQTWNAYNSYFTNGKQFKYKITQYWKEGSVEKSIEQIESSVFISRTKPSLDMQRSENENFTDATPFKSGSTLASSIGYFVGTYSQAQGAPVREARWRVATWVNGGIGEILADTGDVETPLLQFEFNGFFIGNQYAVRCSGKADYQTYGTQDFDSDWINFTAKIPDDQRQGNYTGSFVVHCLPKENAVLLEWEGIEVIPPVTSPEEFQPTIEGGSVILPASNMGTEYSVSWSEKVVPTGNASRSEPIDFAPQWVLAIKFIPRRFVDSADEQVEGIANLERVETGYARGDGTLQGALLPDSPPRRVGENYETKFTAKPYGQFAKTEPYSNGVGDITLYPLGLNNQLISFSYQQNSDGSLTLTTVTNFSPSGADLFVKYTSYSYTTTIETPTDVVDYESLVYGNWAFYSTVSYSGKTLTITLYGRYASTVSATLTVKFQKFHSENKIVELGGGNVRVGVTENGVAFYSGDTSIGELEIPTTSSSVAAILTPNQIIAFGYKGDSVSSQGKPVSYGAQSTITSVSIFGGTNGITIGSVAVYRGDGADLASYYEDPDFEPIWNDVGYNLYLAANFNGNLEGGTGTASGNGFRVYRQEVGSSILTPIATVGSTVTSLKDYGIRSRKSYKYALYAYDNNNAFMKSVENESIVSTCFKGYSLLVCDYDSTNDAYHVRKQYLFSLNLSAGSVGNNNTPTMNANFTQYPTRMPSTQNYASGTLQGLIGTIYTVPALVEQIGGFKHTAKPATLDYFDSVDLEKELYDLSTAPYQLFLRDMEGHLRMIATSNQISMTPDLKKRQIPKTISFPWVEIGDASDVTIIQTPDDYGWNNDGQVLDVCLDVDPTTGVLTANYPKPYDGTKFYLTGVYDEILSAKTPLGITPARFELSEEAKEPDDGILTATAKTNKEEEA